MWGLLYVLSMQERLLRRGWCSCSTPGHPAHFDRRRFISGYDSERAERVASGLSTLLQIGLLFHEYFFLAWWTGSTMTKSHVVISYCNHLNLGNSTHDVDPTTLFNCLHWIHEARFNQLKVPPQDVGTDNPRKSCLMLTQQGWPSPAPRAHASLTAWSIF